MKGYINPEAPIYERMLKKTEIKLRKDIKDNWGRFLDNHFDPNMHGQPFNPAMTAPKDSYKYSSAGLSHKFVNPRILQKCEIEEAKQRGTNFNFKEIREMEEGDMYVFIEYCSNSEKTQMSTNHSEKKYQTFAKRFRQGIVEMFPNIKVFIKSPDNGSKVVKYKVSEDAKSNIIDNQREPLRIGAFEIILARRLDGMTYKDVIFSKLKMNAFPYLSGTLRYISKFVPNCNLAVNI